ncbi:MAG: hypothetical protein IT305_04750 [Chloroflexi bacterium]|nr:hypothetical protein [Chloroflexota bacterium]
MSDTTGRDSRDDDTDRRCGQDTAQDKDTRIGSAAGNHAADDGGGRRADSARRSTKQARRTSDAPSRPIRRGATREQAAMARLLDARGIGRHAFFLTAREGVILPDGLEALSGFVLDEDGRVFGFWLTWDEQRQSLTLAPFYEVPEPGEAFADDAEYHEARRRLGQTR